MKKIIAAAALAISAAALLAQAPAQARPVCEAEFQANTGTATPYCSDHYLAQVARSYGMRVSVADVRNPGTKRQVCEFIGYDNRVYSICSGWRNDNGVRSHR